ncbi:MAG: AraC family transcriptional regulator ligand-binding domain-containing protein [Polyangiales bacterium]
MGAMTGAHHSWQRGSAALGDQSLEVQVSSVLLRALADIVLQRGVSPEQLFGAQARLIDDPSDQALSLAEFQALFLRAVELTKEPSLGLLCGMHAANASFGLMAPLVSHAPTLRAALEIVCQFQTLLVAGARIRLSEQLGVARLRCDLNDLNAVDRSFVELIIAGLVRTLRAFGCASSEISAVCFTYSRPAHYPSYTLAFGGGERFAQAFTGIEFSARALDRPHLHRNAELHELMLAEAQRSLQRQARPVSVTDRVRGLLSGHPASQVPEMEHAARELGLSVRSLRRRLEDEGTSYRELTQRMLYELACKLLSNPELTLHGVAHALGFSDPTAFHRAFRRWSQRTPAEYRAASPAPAP